MAQSCPPTEQQALDALLRLTNGNPAEFVTLAELAQASGIAPDEANVIARSLEQRGVALCAPATGLGVIRPAANKGLGR